MTQTQIVLVAVVAGSLLGGGLHYFVKATKLYLSGEDGQAFWIVIGKGLVLTALADLILSVANR